MPAPTPRSRISDARLNRVADRLHSAAIHLLRRARRVDSSAGLTAERLSLLSVLCFAGPRTVGELADAEMVSRPAVSRTLNGLEDSGLARRERSRKDRRRVVVRPTAKGRRLMEAARRRRLRRISEDLAILDHEALDLLEAASDLLDSINARRGRD